MYWYSVGKNVSKCPMMHRIIPTIKSYPAPMAVVLRLRNPGIKVKSLVLHVCFLILLLLALNLTSLGISFLNCKINIMILSLPSRLK